MRDHHPRLSSVVSTASAPSEAMCSSESGDVPRVGVRGRRRHGGGQVIRADDRHPVIGDRPSRRAWIRPRCHGALAPMSTMTDPGRSVDQVVGDQQRRLAPGHLGGGDRRRRPGDHQLVLLGLPFLSGQLARVAALAQAADTAVVSSTNVAPSDSTSVFELGRTS